MRFTCIVIADNPKLTATKPVSMSIEILYWQAEKIYNHRRNSYIDQKVFSDSMCYKITTYLPSSISIEICGKKPFPICERRWRIFAERGFLYVSPQK